MLKMKKTHLCVNLALAIIHMHLVFMNTKQAAILMQVFTLVARNFLLIMLVTLVLLDIIVLQTKATFMPNAPAHMDQIEAYVVSYQETLNGRITLEQLKNIILQLRIVTMREILKVFEIKKN